MTRTIAEPEDMTARITPTRSNPDAFYLQVMGPSGKGVTALVSRDFLRGLRDQITDKLVKKAPRVEGFAYVFPEFSCEDTLMDPQPDVTPWQKAPTPEFSCEDPEVMLTGARYNSWKASVPTPPEFVFEVTLRDRLGYNMSDRTRHDTLKPRELGRMIAVYAMRCKTTSDNIDAVVRCVHKDD